MKKHLSKILYLLGIVIFLSSIIMFVVSLNTESLDRWVCILIGFIGFGFIMSGFVIDFTKTMLLSPTAGGSISLMNKAQLIELLEKNGIEFEEGREKEYYVFLVKENFEEK